MLKFGIFMHHLSCVINGLLFHYLHTKWKKSIKSIISLTRTYIRTYKKALYNSTIKIHLSSSCKCFTIWTENSLHRLKKKNNRDKKRREYSSTTSRTIIFHFNTANRPFTSRRIFHKTIYLSTKTYPPTRQCNGQRKKRKTFGLACRSRTRAYMNGDLRINS